MRGSGRVTIVPIVEGHGEVEAVPALLNRWFLHRRYTNFGTPREATRGQKGALSAPYDPDRENGIELFIRRAAAKRPDGILVILDADDDCHAASGRPPHEQLGPRLLSRAVAEARHIPIGVVVANREFEAWFLAGFHRLRSRVPFHWQADCIDPSQSEVPRDCKGRISRRLGQEYSPTVHQKELVRHLGFGSYMTRHSRSFRKLLSVLESMTKDARRNHRTRIRQQRRSGAV